MNPSMRYTAHWTRRERNAMVDHKEMIQQAWEYVNDVWEDVVEDIDALVQVESVEDLEHAGPGMPFGPAPREALDRALGIAARLGLATHESEGFIGFADLPGTSERYLATIAHSDIVPLGPGWTVDPLRVTRRDGYLLGRGVLDDKGPLVLSLYAAHYFVRLAREGADPLPYTLRCIVGANEETGMRDVDHYAEHFPQPVFCFTPDACFPLICGEKGRLGVRVSSELMPARNGAIVSLEGGSAENAVPGVASALVRANPEDMPAAEGIEVEQADESAGDTAILRVTARGKGGHASLPEGTENAIGMLVSYLADAGICSEGEQRFLRFERALLADAYGKALGIAVEDEAFGALTCVGGTVRTVSEGDGVRFVQSIDIRYPTSVSGESLLEALASRADECGCQILSHDDMPPFYLSPDADDVRALVDTYQQVTGSNEEAFTIGGGTYARHFARAVAFGPDVMGEEKPDWVGQEHGPDEGVSEQSLKQALVTYIVAIQRLAQLEW